MAPRFHTLPPAQTSSAREALKSFFCELCQKGYTRMNEYESHLSSYDHTHKQRLKDMKAMLRDPTAAARARKQEAKAEAIIIKMGDSTGANGTPGTGGGGFKKGGFKKTGFKAAFVPVGGDEESTPPPPVVEKQKSPSAAAGTSSGPVLSTGGDGGDRKRPSDERKDRTDSAESDTDDEGYEVYDPRHPTD